MSLRRGHGGGWRPGAGRKPGKPDARTSGVRALYTRVVAKQARALWQAAKRAHAAGRGEDPGDAPPKDDAEAAAELIVKLLARGAMKGDGRCAIHLDERLHGRVPVAVEHGGPGSGSGSGQPVTLRIIREEGHGNGRQPIEPD